LANSHQQRHIPVLRCFAVTATYLYPLLTCARRQRQAHSLEPQDEGIAQDTASEPGIAARFATSKAFSRTQDHTERVPHWVRSSSLCGAAVSSDGTILVSSPANESCHQSAQNAVTFICLVHSYDMEKSQPANCAQSPLLMLTSTDLQCQV